MGWHLREYEDDPPFVYDDDTGIPVAEVFRDENLPLVAAAPVLRDLLEEFIKVFDSEEWKLYEGAAQLTHVRAGTHGYTGNALPIMATRDILDELKHAGETK